MSKLHVQLFFSLIFMIFFFYFISLQCEKRPNTGFFRSAFFRIESEYGKIQARKNSLLRYFSRSVSYAK